MPFTATQTRAFFEGADQMALPLATSTQLANEGIIDVEDLAEVDGDIIK